MESTEKKELIAYLQTLPNRDGGRPFTMGPVPHTQRNQFPNTDDFAGQLDLYVKSFQGVSYGISHISDGGLRAYFIDENSTHGFTPQFLVDNEFAHIHNHGSKSLHIVLPPDLGHELEQKGWTERLDRKPPFGSGQPHSGNQFYAFWGKNRRRIRYLKSASKGFLFVCYQSMGIKDLRSADWDS